jgi:hypothetical protein
MDLPQHGLIRHSLDCQRCRPHGRYLERFEQRQIARRISGRRSQAAVDALLAWVRVGRRLIGINGATAESQTDQASHRRESGSGINEAKIFRSPAPFSDMWTISPVEIDGKPGLQAPEGAEWGGLECASRRPGLSRRGPKHKVSCGPSAIGERRDPVPSRLILSCPVPIWVPKTPRSGCRSSQARTVE